MDMTLATGAPNINPDFPRQKKFADTSWQTQKVGLALTNMKLSLTSNFESHLSF